MSKKPLGCEAELKTKETKETLDFLEEHFPEEEE